MKYLVFTFLLIVTYAQAEYVSDEFLEAYNTFEKGSYEEASSLLIKVMDEMESEKRVNDFFAYVYLADAYYKTGKLSDGEKILKRGKEYLNNTKEITSLWNIATIRNVMNKWLETYPETDKVFVELTAFVPCDTQPLVDMKELEKNIIYPESAKKAGVQGKVIIRVYVLYDGSPLFVQILSSESNLLNESAMNAVHDIKFVPAINKGKGVSVWVSVPITYKLRNLEDKKKFFERLFGS